MDTKESNISGTPSPGSTASTFRKSSGSRAASAEGREEITRIVNAKKTSISSYSSNRDRRSSRVHPDKVLYDNGRKRKAQSKGKGKKEKVKSRKGSKTSDTSSTGSIGSTTSRKLRRGKKGQDSPESRRSTWQKQRYILHLLESYIPTRTSRTSERSSGSTNSSTSAPHIDKKISFSEQSSMRNSQSSSKVEEVISTYPAFTNKTSSREYKGDFSKEYKGDYWTFTSKHKESSKIETCLSRLRLELIRLVSTSPD